MLKQVGQVGKRYLETVVRPRADKAKAVMERAKAVAEGAKTAPSAYPGTLVAAGVGGATGGTVYAMTRNHRDAKTSPLQLGLVTPACAASGAVAGKIAQLLVHSTGKTVPGPVRLMGMLVAGAKAGAGLGLTLGLATEASQIAAVGPVSGAAGLTAAALTDTAVRSLRPNTSTAWRAMAALGVGGKVAAVTGVLLGRHIKAQA